MTPRDIRDHYAVLAALRDNRLLLLVRPLPPPLHDRDDLNPPYRRYLGLTLRSTLEFKRSLLIGVHHAPAREGAEDVVGAPLTQKLLDRYNLRSILGLGLGLLPRQRVGDFDHHLHTMATSLDFAELSPHYPTRSRASERFWIAISPAQKAWLCPQSRSSKRAKGEQILPNGLPNAYIGLPEELTLQSPCLLYTRRKRNQGLFFFFRITSLRLFSSANLRHATLIDNLLAIK